MHMKKRQRVDEVIFLGPSPDSRERIKIGLDRCRT